MTTLNRSALWCLPVLAALHALPPLARADVLSPEEALKRFTPAEGIEVTLAAAEPMVRQPVNISFDARGRMWVVQYLQYPNPAGVKPIAVDQFLRTKYDKLPEPPPRGPRGKDRITLLEDVDGDGRYDTSKDFAAGLNIATSVEVGYGGVWVAQAPYLLFYPDRNADDLPDSDPEVVLSGFGMEDTHAVVNHLTWGPDGWLYGAQGSTCTANVRGHVFQQAAWRYHPLTKEFEVFSEGGGNTFGLEWDAHGNLMTGTNYANFVMVHYVQGGYFIKGFAKHGPLSNPYAFGYFDHVPHEGWRGGHVTQLGVIYQGGALPEKYDGKWIAPNLLSNYVDSHGVIRAGATFTTKFEGEFLGSSDQSFRPVDIRTGPDGAVYLADFYDVRANHVLPHDTWDKTNGRIYRVGPRGLPGVKPFNLETMASEQLVGLLSHPNDWYARTARRVLCDRKDAAVVPLLRTMIAENKDRLALQALWALQVSGGFNEAVAAELLSHPTADVRAWTVRLLGDAKAVTPALASRLADLARTEPAAEVRSQLACSARRLPAKEGLPIVRALMTRPEDVDDRYIPLLLWWAIEQNATTATADVLALLNEPAVWQAPVVRKHLIERLGRRFTAERTDANFAAAAKLLSMAPGDAEVDLLIGGMDKGLEGSGLAEVPAPLRGPLHGLWTKVPPGPALLRFALRLGNPEAHELALAQLASPQTPDRIRLIEAVGHVGKDSCVPVLLGLLDASQPNDVRLAALSALQRFADPKIPQSVLSAYPAMPADARARAQALLAGRSAWAGPLLEAIASGRIDKNEIPLEHVRRMTLHKDPKLDAVVSKIWGNTRSETPAELKQGMARVRQTLAEGKGDPARGRQTFTTLCAQCHALHGEGNPIGPDLTSYDRNDLDFLVPSIVDPNAAIRPEYATYTLVTNDDRILNGPILDSTAELVTLEDGGARVTVARHRIVKLEASPTSRMPEKLLDALTPEQMRDLFSYLATDAPLDAPAHAPAQAGAAAK